jgi:methionyl-tRNA formyltransferase
MQFGKIDKFILFGGGQRLVNFLCEAKGFEVQVFSSPRLLANQLDDENITVEEYFIRENVDYKNLERISAVDLQNCMNENSLGISFGAPWIFKNDILDLFGDRLINGHGTRLPKNRGGASFSWQIMRKDRTGCHLFHVIDGGIDTGNIVYSRVYDFPDACRTPKDYKDHHQNTEVDFFKDFVGKVASNHDFQDEIQDESISTYFPRLATEHNGWINWNWSAEEIEQFICAFDEPFMGASTLLNGSRVFLKRATVDTTDGTFHPFMSGLVYRKETSRIFIAAKNASIIIEQLIDEDGLDRIQKLRIGSRLHTPSTYLDDANGFRAVFTPMGLKKTINVK